MPCKECGNALGTAERPANRNQRFCSTSCKTAFNRRRQVRGAILYDLFMAARYERDRAGKIGIDRTFLSRAGEMFRAEDEAQREGRPSWQDPADAYETNAPAINARIGHVAGGRSARR